MRVSTGSTGNALRGSARAPAQAPARGIDGDPAPAPLLGDVGCSTGATGWVEHEVAWVGDHEEAALNNLWWRLSYIDLFLAEAALSCVRPEIVAGEGRKVVKIPHIR